MALWGTLASAVETPLCRLPGAEPKLLPVDDDAGLAVLRAPVQGGENWCGPKGMARALAAAQRVPMSSQIFIEASAQLLPATPTVHLLEHLDISGPLLQEPLRVKDGLALVPQRPGLAPEWDAAALRCWAADV